MPSHRVGNLVVQRILEHQGPVFSPDQLFPDSTREAVEAELHWMAPRWFDTESFLLINCFQSFVLRTDHHTILVDTCIGDDKTGRSRDSWNNASWPYLDNLRAAGVAPEDVDIVLCTHLHVDHVGWNTRLVDGRWVPTFPNATYLASTPEMAAVERKLADRPLPHYADSIKPVLDAGRLRLVDMDHEIDGHARLEPSDGHTPGHVSLRISDGEDQAVIVGDALHHPIQAYYPEWNSHVCEDADKARATRRQILDESLANGTLVMPAHFDPFRVATGPRGYDFIWEPAL